MTFAEKPLLTAIPEGKRGFELGGEVRSTPTDDDAPKDGGITLLVGSLRLNEKRDFEGVCLHSLEGMGYSSRQGNHINVVFVNDCDDDVVSGGNIAFWLGYDFDVNMEDETHEDFHYNVKEFRSKNYQKIKRVLPPLKYGECYGYTPIPALGGKKSYKTLQIVDAKTYVDMIGQATGKIIDLS
ncbi:T6SS immunity protein Tdi1 domain-containing protein [Capnocytophaga canimorsus]|uniref:T6SS immunity protein Tdi1 domain-containing protein n=1 Tax=Capnocytophaga canimorsus TaxID=28188 RepID=UPI00385056B3